MDRYDVIICGAGSAGFCAAVASARMGVKTALIEKYNMPGGILTVFGNNAIDQFNNPYIPEKKMVIAGIGWEFVKRLEREGYARIPDMNAERKSHDQYSVKVNPVAAAKIMDDMLLESGVHLYYGQSAADAKTADGQITEILIATKSGLKSLSAKIYMDCTGDGDLAAFAGASFAAGDGEGRLQPGTLRYYPAVDAQDRILNYGDNQNHVPIEAVSSDAVTRAEIASRKMLFEQMKQGGRIMAAAPAVGLREGRRIAGLSEMNVQDYCAGTVFPDSVCYSYWFVDIHRENAPSYIRYITHDKTPTIRLSAMISKDFSNLMMAGRCVSSDRETNSALRVKASCMAMGEAAATAAAVAIRDHVKIGMVDIEKVKDALDKNGAIIPGKERAFERA
ncbi:MAG: FAD-dependent oxidoreductase [Clostridia bacterium]|nr:FAD-dependent oxidoreductase [Clostridia bacterium]